MLCCMTSGENRAVAARAARAARAAMLAILAALGYRRHGPDYCPQLGSVRPHLFVSAPGSTRVSAPVNYLAWYAHLLIPLILCELLGLLFFFLLGSLRLALLLLSLLGGAYLYLRMHLLDLGKVRVHEVAQQHL